MDVSRDPADVLEAVGRHWGWVLTFGIVTLIAGILALAWPGHTLVAIAIIFGIELIAAGIYRFVVAIAAGDESGGRRVLIALLGVLSFIVGIYAVRHLLLTVAALALILGIYWIVNGVIEVFTAITDRGAEHRGWHIALGVLSIVAGLVVLVVPGISMLTLTIVLGVWLIFFGVTEIVLAFRLRSAVRAQHLAPA